MGEAGVSMRTGSSVGLPAPQLEIEAMREYFRQKGKGGQGVHHVEGAPDAALQECTSSNSILLASAPLIEEILAPGEEPRYYGVSSYVQLAQDSYSTASSGHRADNFLSADSLAEKWALVWAQFGTSPGSGLETSTMGGCSERDQESAVSPSQGIIEELFLLSEGAPEFEDYSTTSQWRSFPPPRRWIWSRKNSALYLRWLEGMIRLALAMATRAFSRISRPARWIQVIRRS